MGFSIWLIPHPYPSHEAIASICLTPVPFLFVFTFPRSLRTRQSWRRCAPSPSGSHFLSSFPRLSSDLRFMLVQLYAPQKIYVRVCPANLSPRGASCVALAPVCVGKRREPQPLRPRHLPAARYFSLFPSSHSVYFTLSSSAPRSQSSFALATLASASAFVLHRGSQPSTPGGKRYRRAPKMRPILPYNAMLPIRHFGFGTEFRRLVLGFFDLPWTNAVVFGVVF